jgi:trehalose 6-phosphate synthase/phosphatase
VLPWRAELLRALLNCDLVGFQIFDYARHFLVCCNRLLALDTTPTSVHYYGRSVRIAARHCSIDYGYFQKKVLTSEVQSLAGRLRAAAGGRPLLLGLDSLDPLQGIVLKLLAFEAFLRDHCHDKSPSARPVLLQIAIPRTSSPPELSQELRRLAARINQNDGTPLRSVEEAAEALARGTSPLLYMEATVTASQRCALLSAAHVLVITSCRDGLNLLPFEYVACQEGQKMGAMIVSEFTGCTRSLSSAHRVNPFSAEEVAASLAVVLQADEEERARKQQADLRYVKLHTSARWAESLCQELLSTDQPGERFALGIGLSLRYGTLPEGFARLDREAFLAAFQTSKRRLMVLNADSLVPAGGKSPLPAILAKLAGAPATSVVVVSARDPEPLQAVFSDRTLTLVAAHGAVVRPAHGTWSTPPDTSNYRWMKDVSETLDIYTDRTDGSWTERSICSLAWHYGNADPSFGAYQAKDLYGHLEVVLDGTATEILYDNKKIEVKTDQTSKARVLVDQLMGPTSDAPVYDFIFCFGDDISDEPMFSALREKERDFPSLQVFTCTLTNKPTKAKFFISDIDQVLQSLASTADASA